MSVSSKKHNFASPTGKYKVHVNSGHWRDHPAARLQISMNNPKHAGDKFFAEAEWAGQRFDKVQLIVSDTLCKYNIMFSHGVDEKTARKMSRAIGDKWIVDNAAAIAQLPHYELTRWDDWLRHPEFARNHAQVIAVYHSDESFAAGVALASQKFLGKKQVPADRLEEYMALSRDYLLEEIAVFGVMHDVDPMIDVRPGSPLKVLLDQLKEIPAMPPGCKKINSVIVDFTKNKGFNPAGRATSA